MKLNMTTDYAIRCVVYMAIFDRVIPASELGEAMNVSREFIAITMRKLKNAGIVNGVRGIKGGFILGKSPNDISLYDIITTIEGDIAMNRISDEVAHKNSIRGLNEVKLFYEDVQLSMEKIFKDKKISYFLGD